MTMSLGAPFGSMFVGKTTTALGSWCRQSAQIPAKSRRYRIRLSLEEARAINPVAELPVDGLVTWDRVQPSETNEFAICLMPYNRTERAGGVFCFFEPPAI